MRTFLQLFCLALALFVFPIIVVSQSDSGRISGVVKDQDGAIVPGATVTVKNDRSGDERTVTSSENGSYSVAALRASTYTVTATATGLAAKISPVTLNVGES